MPGPSRWEILRDIPRIRRSLVDYLLDLSRRYGETVYLPLRYPTYLICNPDDIRHVLATNPRNYHKSGGLTVGKELLGEGLVSGEAPMHTCHRKMMQPMFHRQSIAGFIALMHGAARERARSWRAGATIDLSTEMMELTMSVVSQALFSVDVRMSARELGLVYLSVQRLITRRQREVPIPLWVPTPANLRYRAGIAHINRAIAGMIAARRALAEQPPDLLGMLLAARYDDASPMSDRQIRDEIATLLMAGHETVANHLIWTWYLIALHPEIEARLLAEWEAAPAGEAPSPEQLKGLRYTAMVLAESLRLYPPAWTLARHTVAGDRLPSGLVLRPGTDVIISQYVCHRNPAWFPDPERFDPERWTPEFEKAVPASVYFPFGAGPRYCIGEQFARTESLLILTAIGRQFQLRLAPGQTVRKQALITLRPRRGLKMELISRNPLPDAIPR
jgi:cytochrome P450